jgi:hypothetical protein
MTWLLSIECLDTANAAKTLYFSDDSYVSDSFIVYPHRLIQPSNLNVSPNDGGVLSIFKDSSVGDIELDNTDREFDYLIPNSGTATYKLDGRNAILKLNGTEYLRATIDSISERDNKIVLSLKALWDSMTTPIDLAEYLGDSLGANDLEGDADLKGTAKPIVYGYCKNITPFRTGGADKEIYQASNSDDAVIVATYAKGNRDTNYLLSANASAGASSIVVYGGQGGIPTGSWLAIKATNGEINFYQTTSSVADDATALPATVSLSIPLINSLTGSPTTAITPVEIVNSYTSTAAMIADNGIPTINYRSINGYFRRGSNSASDVITCDVATRPTGDTLTAGLFVVNDYYRIVSIGSTDFIAIGATSNTIGLIFKATGVGSGTGTAQEINPFVTAKAFDVFEKIARSGSRVWSVNQALKSTINTYGDLGLHYDTEAPQKDLLNDVIRSIGGIYWFVGDEIQIYLLAVPSTPSFVIHEYMVLDNPIITRENTGLGINGVPYQGYKVGFDKIETIMTTGLSGVLELNPEIKTFLGNEYRYVKTINETTKSQRLLSKLCEFNTLLRNRSQLESVITRLSALTTQRRDVVSFAVKLDELPVFGIGDTVTLEHRNFGYSAGRNMVIVGYEIDAQVMTVKFLVCG